MSDTRYYYSDANNKPVGPVTLQQLRQLLRDGVINEDTNVIAEGSNNWVRFADVAGGPPTSSGAAEADFNWGAVLFGLLMVVGQFFTLPLNLLKQAGATLSAWGTSKVLPTAQSDLPVLTFLAVVTRPAIHMIFTGIAFVGVCIASRDATNPAWAWRGRPSGRGSKTYLLVFRNLSR